MRLIFWMLFALVAVSAGAQPVVMATRVTPSVPTAVDPVVVNLTVRYLGCTVKTAGFVRNGNVFDLRIAGDLCIDPPPPTPPLDYDLGLLPPGIYTVRVVYVDGPPTILHTFSFSVADAHAPALSPRGMGILAIALATSAFLALRRTMP